MERTCEEAKATRLLLRFNLLFSLCYVSFLFCFSSFLLCR
jgi:hypothetical protein